MDGGYLKTSCDEVHSVTENPLMMITQKMELLKNYPSKLTKCFVRFYGARNKLD